ncbi:alginate export family protein [Ferrovibrio xuzhouensis]|uniref:Alginate export family protein n=1 Tax=Ferrovibrio xuzhouensis TaxID=1576914 RepID=A0ABV7VFX4_9PROT
MPSLPRHRRAAFLAASALTAAVTLAGPARAGDDEPSGLNYKAGALDLHLGVDAGLAYYGVKNAGNGTGSNSRTGERNGGRDWFEGFIAPKADASLDIGTGSLYGGLRIVGEATRGNGDAAADSTTSDQPSATALDNYFLGWKSGDSLSELGDDGLDLSVGRQDFSIGDGFLIQDGTIEGQKRGATILSPRVAFDRTAILRLNTAPVRADVFHLEGTVNQDRMRGGDAAATKLYGANVEWFGSTEGDKGRFEYDDRAWYVGGTAMHLYDADRGVAASRDGMNVFAARTGGALFSSLGDGFKDFGLYSEYAVERNNDAAAKLSAHAWYVEPQYTFSALPWTPRISYRYASFSGDNNSNDGTNHAWDSLYTAGGARGWGTWTQGEITGNYVVGNSNLNSQSVHLRAQPTDDLAVGVIYYMFDYDKKPSGVSDSSLMNEVNAYAEWATPVPGLNISGLVGAASSGKGRQQELAASSTDANDRTIWLGELILAYSF